MHRTVAVMLLDRPTWFCRQRWKEIQSSAACGLIFHNFTPGRLWSREHVLVSGPRSWNCSCMASTASHSDSIDWQYSRRRWACSCQPVSAQPRDLLSHDNFRAANWPGTCCPPAHNGVTGFLGNAWSTTRRNYSSLWTLECCNDRLKHLGYNFEIPRCPYPPLGCLMHLLNVPFSCLPPPPPPSRHH